MARTSAGVTGTCTGNRDRLHRDCCLRRARGDGGSRGARGLTTVSLREWQIARPESGSALAHQSLAAYPAARRLAEELTKTGRMEVLELARGLELYVLRRLSDAFCSAN